VNNEQKKQPVEIISQDLFRATVKIDLAASPRDIERQLARLIKPFRCPKTPEVRRGVELMVMNPKMTAEEASMKASQTTRFARRIAYWHAKLVTGGSR